MATIRELSVNPVFGFETPARYEVAAKQRDQRNLAAGVEAKESVHLYSKTKMVLTNISKICSYLPVIHIVIGIARIMFHALSQTNADNKTDFEQEAINTRMICRGVAEIFIGYLLFIPDLIQTIRDYNTTKQYMLANPDPNQKNGILSDLANWIDPRLSQQLDQL